MVRTVAIAVAVILMIAGGAVGVMKQLEWGPFAPSNGDEAEVSESAEPAEPPRFIDMDPLVVPVFAGDKVAGTIQIQLKLETMGAENEEHINLIMPRLNDAFLRELYSYIPRLLRKEGSVDVFMIKQRLQRVATKVAGAEVVDNVLVQSVTEVNR
jgi:flagellar protein FliL